MIALFESLPGHLYNFLDTNPWSLAIGVFAGVIAGLYVRRQTRDAQ